MRSFSRTYFGTPYVFYHAYMICQDIREIQLLPYLLMIFIFNLFISASFSELILKLNQDLENIIKWLSQNKSQLHTKDKRNKVGNEQVWRDEVLISCYSFFCCMGVELDERMSFENHIDSIRKKVGSGIGMIKNSVTTAFVPDGTVQNLYNSLVLQCLDYFLPLWDNCGSMLKKKLQKLENRACQ